MIISASRRTDIPAYHAPWLMERLREGFAMVANPMNPRQVRRVDLRPEAVDGIVFWSKNPKPLLPYLPILKERGIGVLITDHNVRETLGICDHAYIINQGTVLASGHPDEIIENESVRRVYLGEHFRM